MRGQLDSGPRVGHHPRQAVWGGLEVPGGALAPARTSAEPQTCVAAGPISEGQQVTERTATRARTITTDGLRRFIHLGGSAFCLRSSCCSACVT